jgi:MoaA/NifB/PqqE/SkfB family radical SAM enzyme
MSISDADFQRLCVWLAEHQVPTLGILGGEPTLDKRLPDMLARLHDIGVAPVVFTNALFESSESRIGDDLSLALKPKENDELISALCKHAANIVVNYNDPTNYSEIQIKRRESNLQKLQERGAHITFSKNFAPGDTEWQYLIDACRRFGVNAIRYDISRPNLNRTNSYINSSAYESKCADDIQICNSSQSIKQLQDNMKSHLVASHDGTSRHINDHIVEFVRACEQASIMTGLDCCLPSCMFTTEQLQYLHATSLRFTHVCQPSIDIQTDLQVSYCMPLAQFALSNVLDYNGEWELMAGLSSMAKPLREKRPLACEACEHYAKSCQGGCLALRASDVCV